MARKGGMSKAELRKLLRAEEGLEELAEYQDGEEKKGKNKKDL